MKVETFAFVPSRLKLAANQVAVRVLQGQECTHNVQSLSRATRRRRAGIPMPKLASSSCLSTQAEPHSAPAAT
eukprot:395637-Pleurochrysis_carterae.AAC.2